MSDRLQAALLKQVVDKLTDIEHYLKFVADNLPLNDKVLTEIEVMRMLKVERGTLKAMTSTGYPVPLPTIDGKPLSRNGNTRFSLRDVLLWTRRIHTVENYAQRQVVENLLHVEDRSRAAADDLYLAEKRRLENEICS